MKKNLLFRKLALVAALFLLTAQAFAGGRIYYAGDYPTPHAYLWSGDSEVTGWPGTTMTSTTLQYGGNTVYFAPVDNWDLSPANAIFNIGSSATQTANLNVPGYDYLYTGSGWVSYPVPNGEYWTLSGQLGNDAGWTDHLTSTDGVNQTCTLSLAAGKEYYFKMRHINGNTDTWYTYPHAITRTTFKDVAFNVSVGMDDNTAIATTIAGNYIFTYNTETNKLTITYPDALAESEINTTSVPAENPDVMIQAYYWAHDGNLPDRWIPFGSVQWHDLDLQADTLGKYFKLVWLAPSAATEDYTGFLPNNYSAQGNIWGSGDSLKTLISHLHQAGAKVVADIVINHSSPAGEGNYYNWNAFDFGKYGVFYPNINWITNDDEIFISKNDNTKQRHDNGYAQNAGIWEEAGYPSNTNCLAGDETTFTNGEGGSQEHWSYAEYNCVYSRDWAHAAKEVREMCRAYLTWMKDSIGYDGWRYDFAKGIHGSHLDDYNKASNAAFSVAECFDGDYRKDVGVVIDANRNTYVFDFPGKYNFMNNAIRNGWYQGLLGTATNTMLYNYKKNTVTFVDNHDTFREHHNLCGTSNDFGDTVKVIMANAFILSMPGVPCVFYPHWSRFQNILKPMILARRAVGVHSESSVSDEAGGGYYRATVYGKEGNIRLLLGPNSGWEYCPDDCRPVYVANGIGMYYQPRGMYIKHNWDNGEWTWKIMNDNGDGTYSVDGIYGNGGCNYNDLPSDGANYIDPEHIQVVGNLVIGQKATFTLNPTAGTITVTAAVQPVYFANTKGWSTVYAYMWNDDNDKNHDWPGEAMTLEGTFGGKTIYKYAPSNTYANIIFNAGNGQPQSSDLTCKEGLCYIPEGDGWSNDSWQTINSMNDTISISNCGWTSLYLPFSVELPDDVYAYYAYAKSDTTISLSLLEGYIPAQTGVLVNGSENTHILRATAIDVTPVSSLFDGTKVAESVGDNVYVLSKSATLAANAPVLGLWTNESNLPAAKAYLRLDNQSGAPNIYFDLEDYNITTNIKDIPSSDKAIKQLRDGQLIIIHNGIMYNALGQRVR